MVKTDIKKAINSGKDSGNGAPDQSKEQLYQVIFDGTLVEAESRAKVVENLSQLLGVHADIVRRLCEGPQKVVKKGLGQRTALKYQQVFRQAGVIVRVVTDRSVLQNSTVSSVKNTQDIIRCPHCGNVQPILNECQKCGIVFKKYHTRKASRPPEKKSSFHSREVLDEKPPTASPKRLHVGWIERAIDRFQDLMPGKLTVFAKGGKIFAGITQTLVAFLLTILFFVGIMYVSRMMWYFYISAPVGDAFRNHFPERSQIISQVLQVDVPLFSIQVTLIALLTCFAVGLFAQLFYLLRFFFHSQGLLSKLLFWGLPLSTLVAFEIKSILDIAVFLLSFMIALLPTLCLFGSVFRLTEMLTPEIGDIIRSLAKMGNTIGQRIWPKLNRRIGIWIDRINM
jgi:predicted Zn-ribbon and HTH transcriptional regulator